MKNIQFLLFTLIFILIYQHHISQNFTSSDLPIIIINTNGNEIIDDPKVAVDIGIIDNGPGNINNITDPFNDYNGHCGIEFRGNSTQGFDKKNYSIELWTSQGIDTSANVLGLPKEEDWILHASHVDKTFIRNVLSYDIWSQIGYWGAKTVFCELVIDGDYRGLYILMEKNKRDNDRVDIAKLDTDDNAGDSLTGGYIVRLDWPEGNGFYSNYNSQDGTNFYYQYYYPKSNNITTQQDAYIQSYLNSFENALYSGNFQNLSTHYMNYIDISTFTDLFIINELSRSVDAYKLSSYMHKDRIDNGGLLKAGPIWDFDLAYDNAEYCGGEDETGWTYLQAESSCDDLMLMPMWWQQFMTDPIFVNHLKCRWDYLRQNILNTSNLHAKIDAWVAQINNAQNRNFQRWPVLGVDLFAQPHPLPTTYNEEINVLKAWLTDRVNWLDNNIPGDCSQNIVGNEDIINQSELIVFPIPANDHLYIESKNNTNIISYTITDLNGRIILNKNVHEKIIKISTNHLSVGTYLLSATLENNRIIKKIVIQ